MSNPGEWYDTVVDLIDRYKTKYGEKAYKKNKLELLLRVSRRVDGFSEDCSDCRLHRDGVTTILKNIGDPTNSTRDERKKHSRAINTITKHLKRHHKLVIAGQYIGILVAMGQALGLSFGVAFGKAFGDVSDGLVFGMVAGIIIGVVVGTNLEARAKKKGRII